MVLPKVILSSSTYLLYYNLVTSWPLPFGGNRNHPICFIKFCVLCFFRNATTPLLFCPPSLVNQKFKELKTSRDNQDKLDKQGKQGKQDKQGKQGGPQLLNTIKHKLNFTPDGSLAESSANLFSPALKLINEKYRIRPEFSQNTAVCNKGIIFLYVEGDLHFCGRVLYIFYRAS
jgi:hypothetical protein